MQLSLNHMTCISSYLLIIILLIFICNCKRFEFPGNIIIIDSIEYSNDIVYDKHYTLYYLPCHENYIEPITITGLHTVGRAKNIISSYLESNNVELLSKGMAVYLYYYHGSSARELSCNRLKIFHDYKIPNGK